MSRITITEAPATQQVLPTFAVLRETGDPSIIHNTHNCPDAVTWAVNMNKNGERSRYDAVANADQFELFEVGTLGPDRGVT